MAAIDEARCWRCNRPWPLRRQPCSVYEGDDPIGHEFFITPAAIKEALDGLNRQGILDDETAAEVGRALLGEET